MTAPLPEPAVDPTPEPPAVTKSEGFTRRFTVAKPPTEASTREARARAREGNGRRFITQRNIAARLRRLAGDHRPPEVWDTPRPSLRDVWHYAAYGRWTGQGTLARRLGVAYAIFVAIPAITVGYYLLWILERPARLAAACLLAVLVALTGPGAAVFGACLDFIRWLVN